MQTDLDGKVPESRERERNAGSDHQSDSKRGGCDAGWRNTDPSDPVTGFDSKNRDEATERMFPSKFVTPAWE